MKQYKTIKGIDLVIGETYYDTDNEFNPTILKLIKKTNDELFFEYVSGMVIYFTNRHSLIPFGIDECFYQLIER